MINNFPNIRDLLTFGDEDKFYFIQIFKRRKDNPEMKKDMVIIDNYFVYELEHFNGLEEKIIKQCIDNNARAYMSIIPTKNGLHLICRPFNVSKFKRIFPEIDIHKDNPTILFAP